MRVHAAGRTATTTPGATAGPQLEGAANRPFWVVEFGVFNTTDTEFAIALSRYSASGTVGAAITEVSADDHAYTAATVATGVNSTAATLAGGPYVQATIGAAKGAGTIFTFGKNGLYIAGASDQGIMAYVPTGTGQHFDFYWVWDE